MKVIESALLVMLLFSTVGNTQEKQSVAKHFDFKSGTVTTICYNETIEYHFDALTDAYNGLDEISKELAPYSRPDTKRNEELSIAVKYILIDAFSKMEISFAIKTTCNNETITDAIQGLKNLLLSSTQK